MKMQRNQAKIGIGAGALLALLGLSLVAFAGDLQINRPPMPRTGGAPAGSAGAPSGVPTAIYLWFDGIPGESTDKGHVDWSEALSFDQSLTIAAATSGGMGAGRPVLKDIVVTKVLDRASPKLALAACQGSHHKKVRLDVTRGGAAGGRVFYAYEFTDVLITSYHISGTAGAQGLPVEEISFSYGEIKGTYTEFDGKGNPKPGITWSYNRKS